MTIPTQKPQKESQHACAQAVSQLSRRARPQHLAQDQAQIEGTHVDQLPFQDVLVSAQVSTPQTTRFIAVRKAAFHQLATPSE